MQRKGMLLVVGRDRVGTMIWRNTEGKFSIRVRSAGCFRVGNCVGNFGKRLLRGS